MLQRYFPDPARSRLRAALLPIVFVLIIGVCAGLLNTRYRNSFGLSIITFLAHYEIFHILAHLAIFSTLVIMVWRIVRTQRYKPFAWGFVMVGTLAIEVTQIVTRHQSLTVPVVSASLFDLGVNIVGALSAMIFLRRTVGTS
jgi:hypothetical protein